MCINCYSRSQLVVHGNDKLCVCYVKSGSVNLRNDRVIGVSLKMIGAVCVTQNLVIFVTTVSLSLFHQ